MGQWPSPFFSGLGWAGSGPAQPNPEIFGWSPAHADPYFTLHTHSKIVSSTFNGLSACLKVLDPLTVYLRLVYRCGGCSCGRRPPGTYSPWPWPPPRVAKALPPSE